MVDRNNARTESDPEGGRTLRTKADIVWDIAVRVGVEAPKMSTGSTEPRAIFEIVNDSLGLGIDGRHTKPDMARRIVEAAGLTWNADYESRGGTVTKSGLEAVLVAVDHFVS